MSEKHQNSGRRPSELPRTLPILLDRFEAALARMPARPKRKDVLALLAEACGYRNENAFTAAARRGEFDPPRPISIHRFEWGEIPMAAVVTEQGTFAVPASTLASTAVPSPFGGLVDLRGCRESSPAGREEVDVYMGFTMTRTGNVEFHAATSLRGVAAAIAAECRDRDAELRDLDDEEATRAYFEDSGEAGGFGTEPVKVAIDLRTGGDLMLHVAHVMHRHGMNRYASTEAADLTRQLAEFCEAWWPTEAGPMPAGHQERIDLYFEVSEEESRDVGRAELRIGHIASPRGSQDVRRTGALEGTGNEGERARDGRTGESGDAREDDGVIATFRGRAWIDGEGELNGEAASSEWDARPQLDDMPLSDVLGLDHDAQRRDRLSEDGRAPEAAREWRGPFEVALRGFRKYVKARTLAEYEAALMEWHAISAESGQSPRAYDVMIWPHMRLAEIVANDGGDDDLARDACRAAAEAGDPGAVAALKMVDLYNIKEDVKFGNG